MPPTLPLIPAKAGTQVFSKAYGPGLQCRLAAIHDALSARLKTKDAWVPAFAGMSGKEGLAQAAWREVRRSTSAMIEAMQPDA